MGMNARLLLLPIRSHSAAISGLGWVLARSRETFTSPFGCECVYVDGGGDGVERVVLLKDFQFASLYSCRGVLRVGLLHCVCVCVRKSVTGCVCTLSCVSRREEKVLLIRR